MAKRAPKARVFNGGPGEYEGPGSGTNGGPGEYFPPEKI